MREAAPAGSKLVVVMITILSLHGFALAQKNKGGATLPPAVRRENICPFPRRMLQPNHLSQSPSLAVHSRSGVFILWEDDFEGGQAPWTPVASWTNTPINPANADAGYVFGNHSGWTRSDTISQTPPSPHRAWRNDDNENTAIDLLLSPVIQLPRTIEGEDLLQARVSFYLDLNAPDVEFEGNLQDFFYVRAGRAEALWHFETASPFSGTSHWALRQDSSDTRGAFNVQSLLTPDIDLLGASNPVLRFAQQYLTEANFDYCALDVSLDQFLTYKALAHFSGAQSAYATARVNLKAYAGKNIRLRFRFISDYSWTPPNAHWFLDDIVVQDSLRVLFSDHGGDSGQTVMARWGFIGGPAFIGLDYDQDATNAAALWVRKDSSNIARGSLNVLDPDTGIVPGDSIRLAFHWVTNGSLARGEGRGIFLDDVSLLGITGTADDVAMIDVDIPFPNTESFSDQAGVMRVRNNGLQKQTDIPLRYRLDHGAVQAPAPPRSLALATGAEKTQDFNWPTPLPGVHHFSALADLPHDRNRTNDTLSVAPVVVYPAGIATLGYDDRFNQNVFLTGSKSLVNFSVTQDLRGTVQAYTLNQVQIDLFNSTSIGDQVRVVIATASNDTTLQTMLYDKNEPVPAQDFSPHILYVNASALRAERLAVLVDFSVSNGSARLLLDGGTPFTGHNFFWEGSHWSPSNLGRQIRARISWGTAGKIMAVQDVPADQGSVVVVSWFPSPSESFSRDLADYILWRAAKNTDLLDSSARIIEVPDLAGLYNYGIQYGRPGDRVVVSGNRAWDYLVNLPAAPSRDAYSQVATTQQDSNAAGSHFTTFMVAAYNQNHSFVTAQRDSGFSVDNIAPPVPGGFTAQRIFVNQRPVAQLRWHAVPASDLAAYALYKNGGAAPLFAAVDTVFIDTNVVVGARINYSLAAVDENGNASARTQTTILITRVEEHPSSPLPVAYELRNNFPNPFNPSTTITFATPMKGHVKLVVYNFLGQEVEVLQDSEMLAGFHQVVWEAKQNPSGIYFYRLTGNGFSQIKKMILMR